MMVVAAEVRGRGIGAQLVGAAETALVAGGCQLVEVTSSLARTEAHRFYERLGYERTSVRLAREPGAEGAEGSVSTALPAAINRPARGDVRS
jgi:GNAT superfamily N-acetyltransferase